MGLLEALAESRAFKDSFGVARLDKCVVNVSASASDEAPIEDATARELKGARTLGALTEGMITEALPYLYIRVVLPAGGE